MIFVRLPSKYIYMCAHVCVQTCTIRMLPSIYKQEYLMDNKGNKFEFIKKDEEYFLKYFIKIILFS